MSSWLSMRGTLWTPQRGGQDFALLKHKTSMGTPIKRRQLTTGGAYLWPGVNRKSKGKYSKGGTWMTLTPQCAGVKANGPRVLPTHLSPKDDPLILLPLRA